jgi:xylan 1,4-beta-xylosidase
MPSRPSSARLAAAALLAGAASLAGAAPAAFTIDASAPGWPLDFPFLDCVGSSHGAMALRADYREHLTNVQRDIGFKAVRGHGLLSDDMSAYLGGGANLINLFSVFDFYFSVGLTPLFELSFMPAALAYNASKTIMHYGGITSAPRDFDEWHDFVAQVFAGLVGRYGVERVRTIRTEVWNEPQGCGFYCPPPGVSNQESYWQLYNASARAVKSVDALIPVGGPATAGLAWISDFVNFTGGGKAVPADYVTSHR